MLKHEDDRRILIDILEDNDIRSVKLITVKDNCILGNHYHSKKTEWFYLIEGEGTFTLNGDVFALRKGQLLTIEPNTIHSFDLIKGSILLGMCSQPFDKYDELQS